MSYLRVNGFRIPVAADGGVSRQVVERGRADYGASASLSNDRRWSKRRWDITTGLMPLEDLYTLRDFLHRGAYVWNFENTAASNIITGGLSSGTTWTNALYSSATDPDGYAVTNHSKFGSYALCASGTVTNLFTQNIRTGTDTLALITGFSAVSGGFLSTTTANKWQGSRSLQCAITNSGDGFSAGPVIVTNGQTYTASLYVGSGTARTITLRLRSSGVVIATSTLALPSGGWNRMVVTGTATSASMDISVTANGSMTLLADGFQLEQSTYPNFWVDGSRAVSTSTQMVATSPTGFWGQATRGFAVNFWTPWARNGATFFEAWDNVNGTGSKFRVTMSGASTLAVEAEVTAVTRTLSNAITFAGQAWGGAVDATWRMITAVMRPGGSPELALYIDGVLVNSSSPGVTTDPTKFDRAWIGNANSSNMMNSMLDAMTVFPFPISANCVADMYSYGAAPPDAWPAVQIEGNAFEDGPLYMHGRLESIETIPAYGTSGAFTVTGGTARFVLEEI